MEQAAADFLSTNKSVASTRGFAELYAQYDYEVHSLIGLWVVTLLFLIFRCIGIRLQGVFPISYVAAVIAALVRLTYLYGHVLENSDLIIPPWKAALTNALPPAIQLFMISYRFACVCGAT